MHEVWKKIKIKHKLGEVKIIILKYAQLHDLRTVNFNKKIQYSCADHLQSTISISHVGNADCLQYIMFREFVNILYWYK
jgi:hypothetical protein